MVDTAQTVTGKTGQAALDAIKADSAAQLAFQQALAAQAEDLEKAYLADRESARARDVGLAQAGRRNIRADILAYAAIGGSALSGCCWSTPSPRDRRGTSF